MPLADVSNHGVDATSPRASKPAEQLRAAAGAVAAPGAQAVPGEAGGAAAEQPPPQESEGDLKKNNSLQELKVRRGRTVRARLWKVYALVSRT